MLYMLCKAFLEGWMLLKLHINTCYSLGRRLTVIQWRNVGMTVKRTGDFHVHPLSHSHSLTFTHTQIHTHYFYLRVLLYITFAADTGPRPWEPQYQLVLTLAHSLTHMQAHLQKHTHTHTLWE